MPPPILRMRYPWSVAVSTIRRRWRIPIARVVTNAITGNGPDDARGVHFTHSTVIGVWDQYIAVRVHTHPYSTV